MKIEKAIKSRHRSTMRIFIFYFLAIKRKYYVELKKHWITTTSRLGSAQPSLSKPITSRITLRQQVLRHWRQRHLTMRSETATWPNYWRTIALKPSQPLNTRSSSARVHTWSKIFFSIYLFIFNFWKNNIKKKKNVN